MTRFENAVNLRLTLRSREITGLYNYPKDSLFSADALATVFLGDLAYRHVMTWSLAVACRPPRAQFPRARCSP